MSKKFVYLFSEGDASMRELLGGKGANLAEMTKIGLPVPQGFTVSTEACTQYYDDGKKINDEIMAQIMDGIDKMVLGMPLWFFVSTIGAFAISVVGVVLLLKYVFVNFDLGEELAEEEGGDGHDKLSDYYAGDHGCVPDCQRSAGRIVQ